MEVKHMFGAGCRAVGHLMSELPLAMPHQNEMS